MFAAPVTIPSLSQMHFLKCLAAVQWTCRLLMSDYYLQSRRVLRVKIQESAAFWPSTIQIFGPRPAASTVRSAACPTLRQKRFLVNALLDAGSPLRRQDIWVAARDSERHPRQQSVTAPRPAVRTHVWMPSRGGRTAPSRRSRHRLLAPVSVHCWQKMLEGARAILELCIDLAEREVDICAVALFHLGEARAL
jgi:hypothetical protein